MRYLIFPIIILAALILSINLNRPFYGYHDWNGITYGQIARNYLRYGYATTKLAQVENLPVVSPQDFRYDTHFPPAFTIITSLFMRVFGDSHASIRLPAIIASLFSLYLIYRLTLSITASEAAALSATIIALFTPIFLYFGKNSVHEIFIFPFLLLNTILFHLCITHRQTHHFYLFILTIFTSLLIGWPSYYFPFAAALLGLILTKQKRYLLLGALPFIAFTIFLLHHYIVTGELFGSELFTIIKYRLNIDPLSAKYSFTLSQFVTKFFLFSRNMFTLPLIITSALGLIFVPKYRPILILLAMGLIHPLLFQNAGYLHDYLQFPFLGFISISTALFLTRFISSRFLIPVAFLLAFVSLYTKLEFTKTMITADMGKPEYDLTVDAIKPLPPGETITLTPSQATLLTGVIPPYYLQKEVKANLTDGTVSYQGTMYADEFVITPAGN